MRVIDVMTTEVRTARPETPLKEAARTMAQHGLSGLPVVDETERVVGVISEADLLEREVERGEGRAGLSLAHPEEWPEDHSPMEVGEVMSRGPITARPETPLADAARVMMLRGVKRLPVIDDEGRLVGIVSRSDVVAAFSRPDEVIEDEIREDVLRRNMALDPESLAIAIDEGVVTMRGEVPLHSDARLLDELVRRLEGVVRVDNQLTWAEDDFRPHPSTSTPDDRD